MRKFNVDVEALREYVVGGKTLEEIKQRYDSHALDEKGQYFRTVNKRGGWGKTGNYCGVRYRDPNGYGRKFTDEHFNDYVKKFRSRRGNDPYTIDEYIETELNGQIITEGEYKKLQNTATKPKVTPIMNPAPTPASNQQAKNPKNEHAFHPQYGEAFASSAKSAIFNNIPNAKSGASILNNVAFRFKSILKKIVLVLVLLLIGFVALIMFLEKQFSNISSEYIFDKHIYKNESYYGDKRFGKPSNVCLKKTSSDDFVLANFKGGKVHNAALYYQNSKVTLRESGKSGAKGYGAICDTALDECKIGTFKNQELKGYGLYYNGIALYGAKYKNSQVVKTYEIKKNKFKGYKIEKQGDEYVITVKKRTFTVRPASVSFSHKNYDSSYHTSGDCILNNTRKNDKQYVSYQYNVNGIFHVKSYYELFGHGQYRDLTNSSGEFVEIVTDNSL